MELFTFKEKEVLTTYFESARKRGVDDNILQEFNQVNGAGTISLKKDADDGRVVRSGKDTLDLANQFITFQLSDKLAGPSILESSQVDPKIEGSEGEPDMLVALEMLSFHIGRNEKIDKSTRATIRINIGKDENSRDKYFDTAFWSIAAGLNLYDQAKNKPTDPKDLKSDFKKAFGNRPIEIPGSLSKMTFEVIKHREPAWWQKIFGFLQSDTGKSLVSTIGFPAITSTAINMLDELMNRLDKSDPEVLFKSLPMRLALSKQSRDHFTSGNERVKIGTLNPGFCVLARGKDFQTIVESDAVFYATFGKLVPSKVPETQLLSGKYDDPLADVTYSVFKVGMKSSKLDPTFNYS